MHKDLSKINFNRTHLSHLKMIVNWSGLCEQERCLNGIHNFTQYRYFLITRTNPTSSGEPQETSKIPTVFQVRLNCYDK